MSAILPHLLRYTAGYLACGCAFGIAFELIEGSADHDKSVAAVLDDVVLTIVAWPWLLRALFRRRS